MANKHTKRCSTSLSPQGNASQNHKTRYHTSYPLGWLVGMKIIKKTDNNNCGRKYGENGTLTHRNINWDSHFGKQSAAPQKTKHSAMLPLLLLFSCPVMSSSLRPQGLQHISLSVDGHLGHFAINNAAVNIHVKVFVQTAAAAAAKSLWSCPLLCDPIDRSPPGSPFPGILQARTLEWVATSFSNAWKWKVKVKSLSRVRLFTTPWTAAYQAPPSMRFPRQEYWRGLPLPSPFVQRLATIWPSNSTPRYTSKKIKN